MQKSNDFRSPSFIAYFKRVTSPLVILGMLKEKPMYSYEIPQEMKIRSEGQYTLPAPYTAVYKLIGKGYIKESGVEIYEGKARIYYAITEAGKRYLNEAIQEYHELSAAFDSLVEPYKEGALRQPHG